jgi:hypothetical protein
VTIAARLYFLRMRGFFLRMRGILKIFSENLILFEDIFREIETFFNYCVGFSRIARLFKYIFSEIEAFFKVYITGF